MWLPVIHDCVTALLLWQLSPIPWCLFFLEVFKAFSLTFPRTMGAGGCLLFTEALRSLVQLME